MMLEKRACKSFQSVEEQVARTQPNEAFKRGMIYLNAAINLGRSDPSAKEEVVRMLKEAEGQFRTAELHHTVRSTEGKPECVKQAANDRRLVDLCSKFVITLGKARLKDADTVRTVAELYVKANFPKIDADTEAVLQKWALEDATVKRGVQIGDMSKIRITGEPASAPLFGDGIS